MLAGPEPMGTSLLGYYQNAYKVTISNVKYMKEPGLESAKSKFEAHTLAHCSFQSTNEAVQGAGKERERLSVRRRAQVGSTSRVGGVGAGQEWERNGEMCIG